MINGVYLKRVDAIKETEEAEKYGILTNAVDNYGIESVDMVVCSFSKNVIEYISTYKYVFCGNMKNRTKIS